MVQFTFINMFVIFSGMTWSGTIDLAKWCSTSEHKHDTTTAIQEYAACIQEWQAFIDIGSSLEELCLKSNAQYPVVISAAGELSPLAVYFLALLYRPATSFHSNDSLKNATMAQVILPPLHDTSIYIEEYLPLGVYRNDDVNLPSLSTVARNPKHWMTINYTRRLTAITTIRRLHGLSTVIWLGGDDVRLACTNLTINLLTTMYNVMVAVDNSVTYVSGTLHPSAALFNPMVVPIIRHELSLFKCITKIVGDKRTISSENIREAMQSNGEAIETRRAANQVAIINLIGADAMADVLTHIHSLMYCNLEPLFQLLHLLKLENLPKCTLVKLIQTRIWRTDHIEFAKVEINRVGIEEFIRDSCRLSLPAQRELLSTANALEESGYDSSMLKGPAGSFKAQRELLSTANALEESGYDTSMLKGHAGSFKSQRELLSTANALEESGYDSSMLKGPAGSFKAQRELLNTANALEKSGYSSSMLKGNAGSAKAQRSLPNTIATLEQRGFTSSEITRLIQYNNGSHKVQQAILLGCEKLHSLGFSNSHITSTLAGSKVSSFVIINGIVALCEQLITDGKTIKFIVKYVAPGVGDKNRKAVLNI